MEEMRIDFQLQIKKRNYDTEVELNLLTEKITGLQAENDRLEQELMTTTQDRSIKELELKAIREQLDTASYQRIFILKRGNSRTKGSRSKSSTHSVSSKS
jgi:hypothetical protein